MRLAFSDGPSGESSLRPPTFAHVAEFRTTGVVMNVFLLDPSERLLSAFIWVSSHNTIGLYALPDWDVKEYVFIDTGIECVSFVRFSKPPTDRYFIQVMSSNWSCILHQQHIVIHCEESEAAYQHFYPLSLLRQYMSKLADKDDAPTISCRLPPARTLKKKFIFPPILAYSDSEQEQDQDIEAEVDTQPNSPISMNLSPRDLNFEDEDRVASGSIPIVNGDSHPIAGPSASIQGMLSLVHPFASVSTPSMPSSSSSSTSSSNTVPQMPPSHENPNPYPFPPWYPESAHFVRQWWPSLPNIPRVSCTVVLLASHDQHTHRTRFVLAQHYFRVPLSRKEWENEAENARGRPPPSALSSAASSSSPSGPSAMPVTDGKQSADRKPVIANGKSQNHHQIQPCIEEAEDDALMHLWYVSTPFEVVRVLDSPEEEDDGTFTERPRPLVAVDFGHAVWIEYVDEEMEDEDAPLTGDMDDGDLFEEEDESTVELPLPAPPIAGASDSDPKRIRFVTFPPFSEDGGTGTSTSTTMSDAEFASKFLPPPPSATLSVWENTYRMNNAFTRGMVHTLPTPPGLQLGLVETINIDQSQGAIILSDKGGKIWILCYE